MMEPGYIAFREDYRIRWNESTAEPLVAWGATHPARWAQIEKAIRFDERERCLNEFNDKLNEVLKMCKV